MVVGEVALIQGGEREPHRERERDGEGERDREREGNILSIGLLCSSAVCSCGGCQKTRNSSSL